jgi:hypothetical protein
MWRITSCCVWEDRFFELNQSFGRSFIYSSSQLGLSWNIGYYISSKNILLSSCPSTHLPTTAHHHRRRPAPTARLLAGYHFYSRSQRQQFPLGRRRSHHDTAPQPPLNRLHHSRLSLARLLECTSSQATHPLPMHCSPVLSHVLPLFIMSQ